MVELDSIFEKRSQEHDSELSAALLLFSVASCRPPRSLLIDELHVLEKLGFGPHSDALLVCDAQFTSCLSTTDKNGTVSGCLGETGGDSGSSGLGHGRSPFPRDQVHDAGKNDSFTRHKGGACRTAGGGICATAFPCSDKRHGFPSKRTPAPSRPDLDYLSAVRPRLHKGGGSVGMSSVNQGESACGRSDKVPTTDQHREEVGHSSSLV